MGSINVFTGIQSDASKCKFVSDDCSSPLQSILYSFYAFIYAASINANTNQLHNCACSCFSFLLITVMTCLWHFRECRVRPVHFFSCLSRVQFEVRKALLVFSYLLSPRVVALLLVAWEKTEKREVASFCVRALLLLRVLLLLLCMSALMHQAYFSECISIVHIFRALIWHRVSEASVRPARSDALERVQ